MIRIRSFMLATIFVSAVHLGGARPLNISQDKSLDQTKGQSFSISISTSQAVFQAGSKILVTAIFKNISNHDIIIPLSPPDDWGSEFHLDIRDSKGNKLALRKPHPTGHLNMKDLPLGGGPGVMLVPGASDDRERDVSMIYVLEHSGKYAIQARFEHFGKASVNSNTITITLVP